ncbi:MAG: hypothetical protein IPK80_18490 [Nannocystis sp.]|jgi:HAMP domain-containing protein|nr:hypothetical protein [Nannocystis sp.]
MSEINDDLHQRYHRGLADLRTLRDEIKLKVHLAGMDARAAWEQVEPRLSELERQAESIAEGAAQATTEATDKVIGDLKDTLTALRKRIVGDPE